MGAFSHIGALRHFGQPAVELAGSREEQANSMELKLGASELNSCVCYKSIVSVTYLSDEISFHAQLGRVRLLLLLLTLGRWF